MLWTRATCRALAAEVGPATTEVVTTLLDDRVVDRHARAIRILRLHRQVGEQRLEDACARLLAFGDLRYATLKRVLDQGLEAHVPTLVPVQTPTPARTFVRSAAELLGQLFPSLFAPTTTAPDFEGKEKTAG